MAAGRSQPMTRRAMLVRGAVCAAMCAATFPTPAGARDTTPAGAAKRTFAVIVALTYDNSPANRLTFPRKDADRFRTVLKAPADNVAFLSDRDSGAARATKENILAAVRRVAARTRPGDTFWFYYSGHGRFLPETDSSFLVPADIRSLTEEGMVSVRELRGLLADSAVCAATAKIVVLDACESGSSKVWQEATAPRLTPVKGVLTFAAARPDRKAFETESDPVAGGIFTYYLCAGLAGAATTGLSVTLRDLQAYVSTEVNKACERINELPQEPVFLAGVGTGDWGGVVVAERDDAALAALQVSGAGGITPSQFMVRPNLDAGTILVVNGDEAVREKTASVLKSGLLALNKRVYAAEIAPEFVALLSDPQRTAEAAERLSARRLLRVTVTATSSPSAAVARTVINRVTVRAELLDVGGGVLATGEVTSRPMPSGTTDALRLPVLETQAEGAVQKLLQTASLVNALPAAKQ